MDSQAQLQRTHGQHQAEKPIRIHHPEEEEHHEKGPSKVLKKVKEKAKKIKKALTTHGHGHEHDRGEHIPDDHDLDEEDDEDDEEDQQVHGGVPPRGKAHTPVNEEIVPPGTKVFPVVSSSHTRPSDPMKGVEPPVRGTHASHGHQTLSPPVRPSGVSEKGAQTLTPHNTPVVSSSHNKPSEPIRGVEPPVRGPHASHGHQTLSPPVRPSGVPEKGSETLTPHNTPVSLLSATEDVTGTFVPGKHDSRDQRRVNMERPRGLEEDTAAPGGGSGSISGVSNYQSKVADPTGKAAGAIGAAPIAAALGRRKGNGEDDQLGHGRDLPEKSHGFDVKSRPELMEHSPAGTLGSGMGKQFPGRSHEIDVKSGSDLGKGLPAGTHGLRDHEGFDSRDQEKRDEMQQPNQSSYTDKIASVTSAVTDKAVAAKDAVASKLGYTGEGGDGNENRVQREQTPSSGGGYGDKVVGMVTPVYEKVKETGATVLTKLPLSGGGGTRTETETHQGQDKGVSTKEYLTEKLSPGEEDKVLSEVVAEKLHLGGGGGENTTAPAKRGTVTQSEEVEKRLGGFTGQRSGEARKHGEAYAEEGEGGMVEKLTGAVTSWISGTTGEVMQKSTESSSQKLGSTIEDMSGSGAAGAGQRSGDKSGSVPVQKRFQE